MPALRTADGARIEWRERGRGQDVLLVPYWNLYPPIFGPLTRELEADCRIVTYDDRGTGASERRGPYDLETSAADLEAVCEAAGVRDAVAVCLMDASNRACRVAARRPDLIARVVSLGPAALPLSAFASSEGMIASDAVVGAFRQMIETDYRGALRSLIADTSRQLDEEGVRERVAEQIEHAPQEATVGHLNAWASDEDGVSAARELGERLTVLMSPGLRSAWFPDLAELRRVIARELPGAEIREVPDGIVSAAPENAAEVRRLAATLAGREYDRAR